MTENTAGEVGHALAAEDQHAHGSVHDAFGCRTCLLQARGARDRLAAENEALRERASALAAKLIGHAAADEQAAGEKGGSMAAHELRAAAQAERDCADAVLALIGGTGTDGEAPDAAPEVRRGTCPLHDGGDHVQVRTHGNWTCVEALRGLDEGWPALEAELKQARAELAEIRELAHSVADVRRIDALAAERDKAYRERADLVAYLAACYPSAILTDAAEPDWPIVYIQTPAGQLSWHVARTDIGAFAHVPPTDEATWDGHDTPEKYRRLAELVRTVATGIYGPQPGGAA